MTPNLSQQAMPHSKSSAISENRAASPSAPTSKHEIQGKIKHFNDLQSGSKIHFTISNTKQTLPMPYKDPLTVHESHSHHPIHQPSPHISAQSATPPSQTHMKSHSFHTTMQRQTPKMMSRKNVRLPTNCSLFAVIMQS